MSTRPSKQEILSSYSLDEILDLVKERARVEADERLEYAKNQIMALTGALSGSSRPSAPTPKPAPAPEPVSEFARGRRGRPKGSTNKKAVAGRRGRPKGSVSGRGNGERMPLNALLQEVLNDNPKGIEEIMNALQKRGWESKSKDPRRVLYLELGKQVEKGNIQKSGRGMYNKA